MCSLASICFSSYTKALKKKNKKKNSSSFAHICADTQYPMSKGFFPLLPLSLLSTDNLLKAQSDLFDSPEEIRQPLNTLKSPEPRGRSMEEQFIHYGFHLQLRPTRRRALDNRQGRIEMKMRVCVWGGSFRVGSLFSGSVYVCRCAAVQPKHGLELTVSDRPKVHFIGNCV